MTHTTTTAEARLDAARAARLAARKASKRALARLTTAERVGSAALIAERQADLAAARRVRLAADAEYIAADAALDA